MGWSTRLLVHKRLKIMKLVQQPNRFPGPTATSNLITFVEPGRFTAVPAVRKMRSPRRSLRLQRPSRSSRGPEVFEVFALRHQHGRDGPLGAGHLLHGVWWCERGARSPAPAVGAGRGPLRERRAAVKVRLRGWARARAASAEDQNAAFDIGRRPTVVSSAPGLGI